MAPFRHLASSSCLLPVLLCWELWMLATMPAVDNHPEPVAQFAAQMTAHHEPTLEARALPFSYPSRVALFVSYTLLVCMPHVTHHLRA